MTEKNTTISQQPIHVHFNLQAYNIRNGFHTYETEITRRLSRCDDIEADAYCFSARTSWPVREDLPVRRIAFPFYMAFRNSTISFPRRIASSIFRPFAPFISFNCLTGGNPGDIFVFFENSVPSLKLKGKVIAVLHDIIPIRMVDACGKELETRFRRMAEELIRKTAKIITVSEYSKKDITDYFNTDGSKIEVIHNAVNAEEFSRDKSTSEYFRGLRKKYGLPEKYILHFGSCLAQKNIDTLIRAYAMLPENLRDEYSLMITNPDDEVMKCAGENGVSGRMIYADKIPDEDKPGIYQLASLFAWPSYIEGFGIPILEAQASGVPVVSSNTASMPEVAGNAAVYFDPYDTAGMSEAMHKCLTDEILRSELIAKGYENVKRFSWDESARKFHDIITSL